MDSEEDIVQQTQTSAVPTPVKEQENEPSDNPIPDVSDIKEQEPSNVSVEEKVDELEKQQENEAQTLNDGAEKSAPNEEEATEAVENAKTESDEIKPVEKTSEEIETKSSAEVKELEKTGEPDEKLDSSQVVESAVEKPDQVEGGSNEEDNRDDQPDVQRDDTGDVQPDDVGDDQPEVQPDDVRDDQPDVQAGDIGDDQPDVQPDDVRDDQPDDVGDDQPDDVGDDQPDDSRDDQPDKQSDDDKPNADDDKGDRNKRVTIHVCDPNDESKEVSIDDDDTLADDNIMQVALEEKSSKMASELISNAQDQLSSEIETVPPAPSLPDDSAVEHAESADTMNKASTGSEPLNFEWTFGLNRRIPTLNLTDESRDVVAYAASHAAVLYDYTNNTQKLLQGHGNAVTCIACSDDKRWLVTGEKGEDSCVIVWDTYTGIPVQVIFDIPGDNGVIAVGISNDAKYIVTINVGPPQSVSVWDWTSMEKVPMHHVDLDQDFQLQNFTTFHPHNNEFFVTNSESQVIFFCWERGTLEHHCPVLNDSTFNKVVGTYSQTLFQTSKPKRVLTATSQGNLAVWEPERPDKKKSPDGFVPQHKKRALKLVRVMDRGITALAQSENMVVSGNTAGHVTFFDDQLNLIMNYIDLKIGPVHGISFKYDPEFDLEPATNYHSYPVDSTIGSKRFVVRDFVVSTKSAEVVHVKTSGSVINKILQEHDAAVHAVAASPSKPWICIGGFSGLLKLWDYNTKQVLVTRIFENRSKIRSIAFSHNGLQLAVGMQSGHLHILDAMSLGDEVKFDYSREAITHCVFSLDSKYLATADEEFTTTVYSYTNNLLWKYLGRYTAHYKEINDIVFGVDVDVNQARLLTLGADRVLVEYDLANSSKDDLRLLSVDRIEQSAVPLCLAWYPPITKETFLLTGNDQYKMKLYNTTTKMCRKTLLGPTYGSPMTLMSVVPPLQRYNQDETRLVCYSTKTKVGIQLLPLDGNPHRSTSCIAHPHGVFSIACGYDGNCVFTAGGREATVHMWRINRSSLQAVASLGGEGLTPFYGLLDGGRDGQMLAELENYFYYAQLRSQGINTTEEREVSKVVPLEQVPYIMRALGFYPSEQEIDDMLNEVKFGEYVETGQYVTEIDLTDLIKLYINHRPAFGLSSEELYSVFEVLGKKAEYEEPTINRSNLLSILQRKGEHMTEYELAECLTTLLGQRPEGGSIELDELIDHEEASRNLEETLAEEITPSIFASEILGLNLYDQEV